MTTPTALKHQSRVSWRLLASALLAAVFVTGCGGGGSDSDDATALDAESVAAAAADSKASTTTTASTGRAKASAAAWIYCTWEGGTCSFSGTRQVRYVATTGAAVVKTFTGSTKCTNAVFGDPANGKSKSCYYWGDTTSTPATGSGGTPAATPSGSFSKTQVFAMRNQYISGQQGQYTNFDLRFYGVPMYTNAKVLVHLYDGNGVMRAGTGHHLRYLPTASWRGYLQYQHPVYIPAWLPTGTYRAVVGLYAFAPPWTLLLSQIAGNGVSGLGQGFVVGNLTVTQATQGAAVDQTVGPFIPVPGTAWY